MALFLWLLLLLLVGVVLIVTGVYHVVVLKLLQYANAAHYMVASKDLPSTHENKNVIKSRSGASSSHGKRVIRIVFIRHGQSVWNLLFNHMGVRWPLNVVQSLIREVILLFTNPFDSLILDSPLSAKGRKDAEVVKEFVRSSAGKISFDTESSVVVCSNLRRAMETAVIGLSARLSTTREKIVIDSSLQEGSRNMDGYAFSTEREKVAPMQIVHIETPQMLNTVFDPRLNEGTKSLSHNVYDRMDVFVQHLFGVGGTTSSLTPASLVGRRNSALKEVIAVGHSQYFFLFFRRFLPRNSTHAATRSKMQNGAVVAFDLVLEESTGEVSIDESSIDVLLKGFIKK